VSLEALGLTLGYGESPIVSDVDLRVGPGQLVALIGPNGSGKSTLIRGMARQLTARKGRVLLDGADITTIRARDLARTLAMLPQSPDTGLDLTVEELVSRGRYPHQSLLRGTSATDLAVIAAAIQAADLAQLRSRVLGTLSGGERQRAWIALALAQEPRYLLLDEPTAFLDVRHALEIMELLRELTASGMGVLVALHDLPLAARYADRVAALTGGRLVVEGLPGEVFQPDLLRAVFEVEVVLVFSETLNAHVPVPIAPLRAQAPD